MPELAVIAAICLISLPAFGQGRAERPFTATGDTCGSVTWSKDALQKYPTIGTACQGILQRDGKSYVKFTGEVVSVVEGGRKLTIDFKGGGVFTVSAPENMNVSINKQRTRVRDLRRGDQLSFYIPQDRLAVDVFDGDPATAAVEELPIEPTPPPPEPVAAAPKPQAAQAPPPAQAAPAQAAAAPAPPAPAPRPKAAPVQVPTPPPASSLGTIGWVALAALALIAGALLIRRSMRRTT